MTTLSPPYADNDLYGSDEPVSTPRRTTAPVNMGGPSMSGLVWQNGQPVLRMQDAVVETVVTHVTRTTTSFAPISLPCIPEPDHIPLPTHLSSETYPLAREPIPEDMRSFAMSLAGQRVIVQDNGSISSAPTTDSASPDLSIEGLGWKRNMGTSTTPGEVKRVGLVEAIAGSSGREARKRPLSFSRSRNNGTAPTPPVTIDGKARMRSPPRKRIRGPDEITLPRQDGALLSPLPSPEQEVPGSAGTSASIGTERSTSAVTAANIGSGLELGALFSLPSLVTQFENMPDKLQQHIMMQLLRRSRMPTIQRITAFASNALKRDFVSALPLELAVQILKHVDTRTLAMATRVSKKWRRAIDGERAIWKQRLYEDELWKGHGLEEAEEKVIRQRMQVIRWGEDEDIDNMDSPSFGGIGARPTYRQEDHTIPLKHVYRRRFQTEHNWLHRKPAHRSFPGQGTNVVTCTQFDNEKIVTASDDRVINVYDFHKGTLQGNLHGHEGGVWALEYRGDTLVTGSTDRTVRIWDLDTYSEQHVFHGHLSTVRCLQIVEPVWDEQAGEYFPPYPVFVTGSRDSGVRVWRLPQKGEPRINTYTTDGKLETLDPENNPYHLHHLVGHSQAVRAIAAHGRWCMSASYDGTVRVWDIMKGVCLHVLTGHENRVYSVTYDKYRHRCSSGAMDNTVKVWDLNTGECLHTLNANVNLVGLLEESPNHIVSAAGDATIRVWDANTQEIKQILGPHGGPITCFLHDDTKVVSGSDGSLKLWDIKTGRLVRELLSGDQQVWQIVFKDNVFVVATSRGGVTVFEVFDFGKLKHPSGVDDEGLDEYVKQGWEWDSHRTVRYDDQPSNSASPVRKEYRSRPSGSGSGSGKTLRYNGSRSRITPQMHHQLSLGDISRSERSDTKKRRSERLATRTSAPTRQGAPVTGLGTGPVQPHTASNSSARRTLPGFADSVWDTAPGTSAGASKSTRHGQQPDHVSPRAASSSRYPLRHTYPSVPHAAGAAGSSRISTRTTSRRMGDLGHRGESPTPAGVGSSSRAGMMAGPSNGSRSDRLTHGQTNGKSMGKAQARTWGEGTSSQKMGPVKREMDDWVFDDPEDDDEDEQAEGEARAGGGGAQHGNIETDQWGSLDPMQYTEMDEPEEEEQEEIEDHQFASMQAVSDHGDCPTGECQHGRCYHLAAEVAHGHGAMEYEEHDWEGDVD